jgi:hypothetical protein
MKDCKHERGDYVNGYWLCAACYKKLDDRPRTYIMQKSLSEQVKGERQEVFVAPIAAIPKGLSLSRFVKAMAMRLISQTRGSFTMADALDYAVEILRNLEEPFGSADFQWTVSGAWELVSEDMQYWDNDAVSDN